MGHGATTSDAEDGSGIAHVAHEDVGGVVRYTVTTFEPVRQDGVTLMRWDLDLDGDGRTAGRDDGCILLRPVKGRRVLHADLYDGCNGDPVAGADVRAKGNTLKLRFLLEEMRDAGLADGAASYGYRFRFVDRNGTTDDVPDAPGALITHAIGKAGGTSKEKAASTPKTSAPERSETPSSSSDVVVGQQRAESSRGGAAVAAEAKDTKSTGNANEEVVEAGDDVEISGSGFGRNQALTITLVGGAATSTATPAPSPSA